VLIEKAFGRDSLNLEIRFIRFAIQRNLPSFLRYHDELERDKQFLLINTRYSNDPELKEMILNYLETKN
jgi:DNA mismatch repair ATPase MutL